MSKVTIEEGQARCMWRADGGKGKSVTGACIRAVIWVETTGSDKVAPLCMVTHLMIVLGLGLAREFAIGVVAVD